MLNRIPKNTFTVTSITICVAMLGCSNDTSTPPKGTRYSPLIQQPIVKLEETSDVSASVAQGERDASLYSRSLSQNQKNRLLGYLHAPANPHVVQGAEIQLNPDAITRYERNTEQYQALTTSPVIQVASEASSTFSIDVDTAAYANVRRFLNSAKLPPSDAVRIEELVNYFSYDYPVPDTTDVPFSINTEISTTPWNPKTKLLHIGLKGYDVQPDERPNANLVFLIDVSGSMASANKLGLLKSSIHGGRVYQRRSRDRTRVQFG